MIQIDVYDPAQCCSTGVCGPVVDDSLARFGSVLEALKSNGATVSRYNLSQQPGAFVENPIIRAALEQQGVACLPLIMVDGKVLTQGRYPSGEELGAIVTVSAPAQSCCAPAADAKRCCG